jgi:hypothetical protein
MRGWVLIVLVMAACGPKPHNGDGDADGGPPPPDARIECTQEGATHCAGSVLTVCQGGVWVTQESCARMCSPTLGCVDCLPELGVTCVENDVHACTSDGRVGDFMETCSGALQCEGGGCRDLCGDAARDRSYLGCDYLALDLWNIEQVSQSPPIFGMCSVGETVETAAVCWKAGSGILPGIAYGLCDNGTDCSAAPAGTACETHEVCIDDGQHAPYAIVVANPSLTGTAHLALTTPGGESAPVDVAPGEVKPIFPADLGLTDQSIVWSSLSAKGYHITSSRPIVAYQFNPLHNVGVFSNDASLLLPTTTYGDRYYVVTQPSAGGRPEHHDVGGYASIVAAAPTTIAVTASAPIKAGLDVPAIASGATQTFTLTAGQVLTLTAEAGSDLTGTLVESTDHVPFGAFAGHVCAAISNNPDACCCDHLEDQLFPTSTWGKTYAVARSLVRGGDMDRLRIIAKGEDTTVTFDPPLAHCPTMTAGEWCEVDIPSDVIITANQPVMVGQFLLSLGSTAPGSNPQGDPALAFVVPVEQFRAAYDLLVPSQYVTNFFAIVAPGSGPVILDGMEVGDQLAPFGSGTWRAGRIEVAAGRHRLECGGCGVTVGGYDAAVSYLFAGGLDLEQIEVD